MEKRLDLNPRQQKILYAMLTSDAPLPLPELADLVHVSVRTVQRDMRSLRSLLLKFGLEIASDGKRGQFVKGAEKDRQELRALLSQHEKPSMYTPEERRQGLIRDLLLAKEPIKLYTFSRQYDVTEATISYDMDKVEEWFQTYGIRVVRRPGLGVYLHGTEQQFRTAASCLLQQDMTVEKWMELFLQAKNQHPDELVRRLDDKAQYPFATFLHLENILSVEKAISKVLQTPSDIRLTDRDYVNLVIHLALAIERVKHGEFIESHDGAIDAYFKNLNEFPLAQKIADVLEQELHVTLPDLEIGYITLHLYGTQNPDSDGIMGEEDHSLNRIELARSLIRGVEHYLGKRLADDEILFNGLMTHLVAALNRLRRGLQIHNPLLEEIKKKYGELYTACEKASEVLAKRVGQPIPAEEIGYIAMHFGAALLRRRERDDSRFRALVVCASGIGTGHFLASRLKKELSEIDIQEVVSVIGLKEWIRKHGPVDMVISTVNLPELPSDQVVIVSPFLQEKDLAAIRRLMEQISSRADERQRQKEDQTSALLSNAKYGEAVSQLIRNFVLIEQVESKTLSSLLQHVRTAPPVCDFHRLLGDIEEREKLGGFTIQDLAMIHAKTPGVQALFIGIFRLKDELEWKRADGGFQQVNTFLLLAAPAHSPKEHLEMISELSAALVRESFVDAILKAPEPVLRKELEQILSEAYREKTDLIHKEH